MWEGSISTQYKMQASHCPILLPLFLASHKTRVVNIIIISCIIALGMKNMNFYTSPYIHKKKLLLFYIYVTILELHHHPSCSFGYDVWMESYACGMSGNKAERRGFFSFSL